MVIAALNGKSPLRYRCCSKKKSYLLGANTNEQAFDYHFSMLPNLFQLANHFY